MPIFNKQTEKILLNSMLKYATGYDLEAVNDKISKINKVLKDKPTTNKAKKHTDYEDVDYEEIK